MRCQKFKVSTRKRQEKTKWLKKSPMMIFRFRLMLLHVCTAISRIMMTFTIEMQKLCAKLIQQIKRKIYTADLSELLPLRVNCWIMKLVACPITNYLNIVQRWIQSMTILLSCMAEFSRNKFLVYSQQILLITLSVRLKLMTANNLRTRRTYFTAVQFAWMKLQRLAKTHMKRWLFLSTNAQILISTTWRTFVDYRKINSLKISKERFFSIRKKINM